VALSPNYFGRTCYH